MRCLHFCQSENSPLRTSPVAPTARIKTYAYKAGAIFSAELWMLNDSTDDISDTVSVYVEIDGKREHLMDWNTGTVAANTNNRGHTVSYELPRDSESNEFTLVLESAHGSSRYPLMIVKKKRAPIVMNDPLN